MLAYKIQTTGNYAEESIQHSKHGESFIAIGTALQGGLIYDKTGQQGYGSSVFFMLRFVA
jgi:hypothetical protein